ncbi:MAG: amidase [Acidimicrobiia bacterium]
MELKGLAAEASAVRAGEISALKLAEAYLTRIAAHEELNAYIEVYSEGARTAAARIDQDIEGGTDPGPLAGGVVALKDLCDHEGHVTTAGSAFYRHEATRSATAVSRLEQAGAVLVGKTGLHEFAYGFSSENDWFGPVRNPWDVKTSPGGSSGGSASATAAGLAAAALGTDTGGSIRVPAALCGLFGLKVTHGRVPLAGVFPLAASLDTVGPLARSTDDAALLYMAMAGYDAADPWSASVPVEPPMLDRLSIEGLKAGIPQPWLDEAPSSRSIISSFDKACADLEDLGMGIETVEEPDLTPPGMALELLSGEVAAVHRAWFEDPDRQYGPEVGERVARSLEVTADEYVAAQAWRARLRNTTRRIFDRVDLLITPTVPALPKVIGEDTMGVDGEQVHYRIVLSWFSYMVNQMGAPALALPLRAEGAPPPSLQLIGPWWSEHQLLEIGAALEQAGMAGFRAPPLSKGVASTTRQTDTLN